MQAINDLWESPEVLTGGLLLKAPICDPKDLPSEKNKAMNTFLDALTEELEQQRRVDSDHARQFIQIFDPIVAKMRAAQSGLVKAMAPQDVSAPRSKISLFLRNARHRAFMKNTLKDMNGLINWIQNFYCEEYLLPHSQNDEATRSKRLAILTHLKKHPPQEAQTIETYLKWRPGSTGASSYVMNRTMAELIGENRTSSNPKKQPWGMQKLMESFGYKIEAGDIKPAPKSPKIKR